MMASKALVTAGFNERGFLTGGTSRYIARVSQQRSDNVNNRTVLQTKVEDIQSLQGYQGLVRAISN